MCREMSEGSESLWTGMGLAQWDLRKAGGRLLLVPEVE